MRRSWEEEGYKEGGGVEELGGGGVQGREEGGVGMGGWWREGIREGFYLQGEKKVWEGEVSEEEVQEVQVQEEKEV